MVKPVFLWHYMLKLLLNNIHHLQVLLTFTTIK